MGIVLLATGVATVIFSGMPASVNRCEGAVTDGVVGTTPLPVRLTLCVPFPALSVNVSDAVFAPVVPGLNVTSTLQLAPAGTVVRQALAGMPKSAAFPPVSATLPITRFSFPLFVTVTVCGVLAVFTATSPKASVPADRVAVGCAPVPVSATVCVEALPPESSLKVSVALLTVGALGLNVTDVLQVALAARVPVQAFGPTLKSAAFVPANATGVVASKFSVAAPVFFTVTVCGALVVPTCCGANVSVDALRLALDAGGAAPLPVSATFTESPVVLESDRVPVAPPTTVGSNVTDTVQVPSCARVAPSQVLVLPATTEKGPVAVAEPSVSALAPRLVTVTFCATLVVPVGSSPNARLVGVATSGPASLPATVNRSVDATTLPAESLIVKTLVSNGLPTTFIGVTASPMKPVFGTGTVAGSLAGERVRNGPTRLPRARPKSQLGGTRVHPVCSRAPAVLTGVMVPSAFATSVMVPYGSVTVYLAPGVRPLALTSMRPKVIWSPAATVPLVLPNACSSAAV